MIDTHSVYIVAVISQTCLTVALLVLASTDPRSRGIIWLTAASALQLLVALTLEVAQRPLLRTLDPVGAYCAIALFFCICKGVRWYTYRSACPRSWELWISISAFLVTCLVSQWKPSWSLTCARITGLVLLAATLRFLFHPRIVELRTAARASGCVTALFTVVVFARLLQDARIAPTLQHFNLPITMALVLFGTAMTLSHLALYAAECQRLLYVESRLDMLTGLQNRRSMEESANRAVREALDLHRPLALLMIDVDHFKQLNDTWGHSMGDIALRTIANVLLRYQGGGSHAARMGGEEFAVLLAGADALKAAEIAEQLRSTVQSLSVADSGAVATFTVSMGIAHLKPQLDSWHRLLRRADLALYRAKDDGRNRVALAEPHLAEPHLAETQFAETPAAPPAQPAAGWHTPSTQRYPQDPSRGCDPAFGLLTRNTQLAHHDGGLHIAVSRLE